MQRTCQTLRFKVQASKFYGIYGFGTAGCVTSATSVTTADGGAAGATPGPKAGATSAFPDPSTTGEGVTFAPVTGEHISDRRFFRCHSPESPMCNGKTIREKMQLRNAKTVRSRVCGTAFCLQPILFGRIRESIKVITEVTTRFCVRAVV